MGLVDLMGLVTTMGVMGPMGLPKKNHLIPNFVQNKSF